MLNSAERSADIFSPRLRAVEEPAARPEGAAPAAAGVAAAQLPEEAGAAARLSRWRWWWAQPSVVAAGAVRRHAGVAAGAQPRVAEPATAPLPGGGGAATRGVGGGGARGAAEGLGAAASLGSPSALHWLAAGELQHLASAGRASARQPRQAASDRQPFRGHSERPVPEAVIPAAGEQAWHWDWPRSARRLPPPVARVVRPWHRARAAYWPSATPVALAVRHLERSRSAPRWRAAARSAQLLATRSPGRPERPGPHGRIDRGARRHRQLALLN